MNVTIKVVKRDSNTVEVIWPEEIEKLVGFTEAELCDLLKNLGIRAHYRGYGYLKTAILLYSIRMERMMRLYSTVAQIHKVKGAAVERAIRTAVEAGRRNCGFDFMISFFGNTLDANKGKATNEQFIATACEYLKTNGRGVCRLELCR